METGLDGSTMPWSIADAVARVVRTQIVKRIAPPKAALEYTNVPPSEMPQVTDGNGEYYFGEPF